MQQLYFLMVSKGGLQPHEVFHNWFLFGGRPRRIDSMISLMRHMIRNSGMEIHLLGGKYRVHDMLALAGSLAPPPTLRPARTLRTYALAPSAATLAARATTMAAARHRRALAPAAHMHMWARSINKGQFVCQRCLSITSNPNNKRWRMCEGEPK